MAIEAEIGFVLWVFLEVGTEGAAVDVVLFDDDVPLTASCALAESLTRLPPHGACSEGNAAGHFAHARQLSSRAWRSRSPHNGALVVSASFRNQLEESPVRRRSAGRSLRRSRRRGTPLLTARPQASASRCSATGGRSSSVWLMTVILICFIPAVSSCSRFTHDHRAKPAASARHLK
jgi:hypothetical protein